MTAEVSYRYSELDKQHQIGIEFKDVDGWEVYVRWVWFYLGANIGTSKNIHPYNVGKVIKVYKNCNDAQRQAKFISNKINKLLTHDIRQSRTEGKLTHTHPQMRHIGKLEYPFRTFPNAQMVAHLGQ